MKFYVEIYLDHNLGDDLFLDTLLQRYPEHKFYVGMPEHITNLNVHFKKYNNLKTIKPINFKNAFKLIGFDAHILIGGSIYMDLNNGFHKLWLSRLLKSFICFVTGKPFFVLGANLGPFNTKIGTLLLWMHFNLINHISVRDSHSFNILEKWKKIGSFDVLPDVVFSHDVEFPKRKQDNNILGISVINTKRHPHAQDAYVKKIRELTYQYLIKFPSGKVLIMGFDGGLENDGDVIKKILSDDRMKMSVEDGSVEVNDYNQNVDMLDYLDDFQQCNAVICSRFHAMILAMKYEQRFFPICYSEKMENVLLDMKSSVAGIKYENISYLNVNEVMEFLFQDGTTFFDKTKIHTAKEHFNCIDELIASKNKSCQKYL
ncbi:polysaccharide pyruvyl transferase family protein [Vibrio cholerae]|uniref:polysaccharide pyruvyl transferase family protein n=1 Tax=Vibrio cholerae TaxID=666 RepID=UPI001A9E1735|nr:polysaccharide pyruvyl transferase family protein [Vibrio cholerae]MBO1366913.1 hypothetical protein [Vibrio cholerae]MBO1370085.1 hypothetical protein [Vibrio cholerae]MBO1373010.1 hypothetical protein [Vibrio cholerae]MBO1377397.1 hypothetical protein [Vibrio cholerae]MBO1406825.1 hypothetical protein [Vibrio cholerae]